MQYRIVGPVDDQVTYDAQLISFIIEAIVCWRARPYPILLSEMPTG